MMPRNAEFIEPHNIECRAGIRVPVRIPVTIVFPPLIGHQSIRTVTQNLSLDGALTNSRNPSLVKGTHVRLLLEIADTDPIIIFALVVRNTAAGSALMFTIHDSKNIESLSTILAAEFNKHLDARSAPRSAENGEPFATSVTLHR